MTNQVLLWNYINMFNQVKKKAMSRNHHIKSNFLAALEITEGISANQDMQTDKGQRMFLTYPVV